MSGELNQWIWDTMVSMTLLMLLVLMIRKPVSHFFGARIAYLLWILPLARLFMPTLTLEAPAPVEPAVTYMPAATGSELMAAVPAEATALSAFASLDWIMIATILWLGGAGLLFISKLAAYLQFKEDIVADGRLIGRHGKIKILETAAVGGPLAFGLFEKYIAVPTNFFRDYAPRERKLVLEHEIAHHESGDLAANFVGLSILSLHWFNPVAWFAWIAFREDQETACDARIIARSSREVRAVYGRTIAKSVSGHQLGLASPLNQKDKIKGRLKMLGQSEKSGFRNRLGMLLVTVSAAVSLPLTATVVYAEADVAEAAHDPAASDGDRHVEKDVRITVDENGKEKKVIKIRKTRDGKSAGSDIDADIDDTPSNGDHVRIHNQDGKKIVIRTSTPISDEEFQKMIKDAEQSRIEAEADIREHQQEMREHQREMRLEMREVEREIEEAKREAKRELREAQREALAERREATREAREEVRQAARLSSITYSTRSGVGGPDCVAMNRQIAMGGKSGLTGQAWAVVAGCGGFEVKVDRTALLKEALAGLEKGRTDALKCKDGKIDRAKKIEDIDRSIAKVKAQLSMT